MTEIIVTTNEPESEELRIPSYSEHLWLRCPKDLREHFDTKRKGVFEIAPPCFEWNIDEDAGKIEFTFKWGCDLNNVDIPVNENGTEEHLWVKSIRGLKYLHPSRAFNKVMKHKYPGLFEQQHFSHEWNDNNDVITLVISWNLNEYIKPEENND